MHNNRRQRRLLATLALTAGLLITATAATEITIGSQDDTGWGAPATNIQVTVDAGTGVQIITPLDTAWG